MAKTRKVRETPTVTTTTTIGRTRRGYGMAEEESMVDRRRCVPGRGHNVTSTTNALLLPRDKIVARRRRRWRRKRNNNDNQPARHCRHREAASEALRVVLRRRPEIARAYVVLGTELLYSHVNDGVAWGVEGGGTNGSRRREGTGTTNRRIASRGRRRRVWGVGGGGTNGSRRREGTGTTNQRIASCGRRS